VNQSEAIALIAAGLTPRELEHEVRHGAAPDRIAVQFAARACDVSALMARWGLGHLAGRDKSGVDVVAKIVSKRRK